MTTVKMKRIDSAQLKQKWWLTCHKSCDLTAVMCFWRNTFSQIVSWWLVFEWKPFANRNLWRVHGEVSKTVCCSHKLCVIFMTSIETSGSSRVCTNEAKFWQLLSLFVSSKHSWSGAKAEVRVLQKAKATVWHFCDADSQRQQFCRCTKLSFAWNVWAFCWQPLTKALCKLKFPWKCQSSKVIYTINAETSPLHGHWKWSPINAEQTFVIIFSCIQWTMWTHIAKTLLTGIVMFTFVSICANCIFVWHTLLHWIHASVVVEALCIPWKSMNPLLWFTVCLFFTVFRHSLDAKLFHPIQMQHFWLLICMHCWLVPTFGWCVHVLILLPIFHWNFPTVTFETNQVSDFAITSGIFSANLSALLLAKLVIFWTPWKHLERTLLACMNGSARIWCIFAKASFQSNSVFNQCLLWLVQQKVLFCLSSQLIRPNCWATQNAAKCPFHFVAQFQWATPMLALCGIASSIYHRNFMQHFCCTWKCNCFAHCVCSCEPTVTCMLFCMDQSWWPLIAAKFPIFHCCTCLLFKTKLVNFAQHWLLPFWSIDWKFLLAEIHVLSLASWQLHCVDMHLLCTFADCCYQCQSAVLFVCWQWKLCFELFVILSFLHAFSFDELCISCIGKTTKSEILAIEQPCPMLLTSKSLLVIIGLALFCFHGSSIESQLGFFLCQTVITHLFLSLSVLFFEFWNWHSSALCWHSCSHLSLFHKVCQPAMAVTLFSFLESQNQTLQLSSKAV